MLCLLPILRKVRKLKHNYIIVMRPKLYTRKKKIRGGNTAVMSRSRLDDIGPRVDNMVNNAVANVDPYALQMKAKNAVMAQADAIQTAATNTADNLKVVATLDPNNDLKKKTVLIRTGNKFIEQDYYQFDPYAKSILSIIIK